MMAVPTIRIADVNGCPVQQDKHAANIPAALLKDPVELSNACRAFYKSRVEATARMKERAQRRGSSSSSNNGISVDGDGDGCCCAGGGGGGGGGGSACVEDGVSSSSWRAYGDAARNEDLSSSVTSCVSNGAHARARRRASRDRSAMDTAMAVLTREMAALMDLDLRLMKQLLILNEEIEDLKWRRRRACADNCGSSHEGSWDMMQSAASLSGRLEAQPALKFSTPSSLSLQLEGIDSVRFSVYDDEDNNNTFNRGKIKQPLQHQQRQQQLLPTLSNSLGRVCTTTAVTNVCLNSGQTHVGNDQPGCKDTQYADHKRKDGEAFEQGHTFTKHNCLELCRDGSRDNHGNSHVQDNSSNMPCLEYTGYSNLKESDTNRSENLDSSDRKQVQKTKRVSHQCETNSKNVSSTDEKLSKTSTKASHFSRDEKVNTESDMGTGVQKFSPIPAALSVSSQEMHFLANTHANHNSLSKLDNNDSLKVTATQTRHKTSQLKLHETNTHLEDIAARHSPRSSYRSNDSTGTQNVATKTSLFEIPAESVKQSQKSTGTNPPETLIPKKATPNLHEINSSLRPPDLHTSLDHNDHAGALGPRKKSRNKFIFRPGSNKLSNGSAARQPKKKTKDLHNVSKGDAESHDSGINDVFN